MHQQEYFARVAYYLLFCKKRILLKCIIIHTSITSGFNGVGSMSSASQIRTSASVIIIIIIDSGN
jgi:hypothetical protein